VPVALTPQGRVVAASGQVKSDTPELTRDRPGEETCMVTQRTHPSLGAQVQQHPLKVGPITHVVDEVVLARLSQSEPICCKGALELGQPGGLSTQWVGKHVALDRCSALARIDPEGGDVVEAGRTRLAMSALEHRGPRVSRRQVQGRGRVVSRHDGRDVVIPTGFKVLDETLGGGLRTSQVTLLAGVAGVGTSIFALHIARNAALRHGQRTLFVAPDSAEREILTRIIAAETRTVVGHIRSGRLGERDRQKLAEHRERLSTAPILVNCGWSVAGATDTIVDTVRVWIPHGVKFVVVDNTSDAEPRTRELVKALKLVAQTHQVAVVVVSKVVVPKHRRCDPPVLEDLREYADFADLVDVALLLHRDDMHDRNSTRPAKLTSTSSSTATGPRPGSGLPFKVSTRASSTCHLDDARAEIGDARGRFPTPESLVCLAGAAPSTRQSGKVKIVTFRWAVDKQLRGAVVDFAGDSHHANPWAADLYQRARARGHDHPHAVRILARAWLHIIWRCWQDNVPYDPAKHRALQRLQHQAA